MNFLEFWNFGKLNVFLIFFRIPKKTLVFLEFDPKTFKKNKVFLEFQNKFQKNLGFFKVFYQYSKKPRCFFLEFFKISKKPWVFQNSKIPKIFGEIDEFFGILEFWKTQCFFGILKNSKNTLVFFLNLIQKP